MVTSTFTQLLSSEIASRVQCCFTFKETILRTIRGGEPRTATSTVTLLLSSDTLASSMLLYAHRDGAVRDGEPRTSTSTVESHAGTAPEL